MEVEIKPGPKQGSISFLKKRNKKLFSLASPSGPARAPNIQKFFGSFFQKRTAFFALAPR
jgi:hypothetical protein